MSVELVALYTPVLFPVTQVFETIIITVFFRIKAIIWKKSIINGCNKECNVIPIIRVSINISYISTTIFSYEFAILKVNRTMKNKTFTLHNN